MEFNNLQKKEIMEEKLVKNKDNLYIFEIFASLKYILEQIISYDKISNKSIKNILKKYKLKFCSEILKNEKIIMTMKVENIISIFEFFQIQYFKKIMIFQKRNKTRRIRKNQKCFKK